MPKINPEKSLMRPMSQDQQPTDSTEVLLDFEEIGHFLNENTGVSETAEDRPSCLPVAQKLRQVPQLLQKPLYEWLEEQGVKEYVFVELKKKERESQIKKSHH